MSSGASENTQTNEQRASDLPTGRQKRGEDGEPARFHCKCIVLLAKTPAKIHKKAAQKQIFKMNLGEFPGAQVL